LHHLDLISICRCSMVCKRWAEIIDKSNHFWVDICKKTMKQRIQEDRLVSDSNRGTNVRKLILEKLTYDKILDIMVRDLIQCLQLPYDDRKKRKLDRSSIVTDEFQAEQTLKTLQSIISTKAYTPESLSFQAALEPLLCCLSADNVVIRKYTINILEYLLIEPENRLIIASQGYIPYLFRELLGHDQQQISRILLQLPLQEQYQHYVTCDLCGESSYNGVSYKCLVCNDWDYCSICYCLARHSRNHIQIKMQKRNYQDYATIAKNITMVASKLEMDQESKTHFGYSCAACGLDPIHGVRYVCLTCGLSNLCQKCESKHHRLHCFLKFRYPFKNIQILTSEEKLLLTTSSGVIPQDTYLVPEFYPVFAKTIPPHENLFQKGHWKFYYSGMITSYLLNTMTLEFSPVVEDEEDCSPE